VCVIICAIIGGVPPAWGPAVGGPPPTAMWCRAAAAAHRAQASHLAAAASCASFALWNQRGFCLAEEPVAQKKPKVVLCSNAFKGCISARQACDAMRRGVEAAHPGVECCVVPLADGGDTTLEVLVEGHGGFFIAGLQVQDPLGRPTKALYGMIDNGKTAVIEMAKASGLKMLEDDEKDPLAATTLGTGQLMSHALHMGVQKIILCVGGSATNDGGVGAAHALGYRFLDENGAQVEPIGGRLQDIHTIDSSAVDPLLAKVEVIVAVNINNPLCGPSGCTAVWGPVKGVKTPEVRERLDKGLAHLANLWVTQLDAPKNLAKQPGCGASGGLGGGAVAFFGARFESGFNLIANQVGLEENLAGAAFAITGEGRVDEQTGVGKVPYGVAELAHRQGVPLCGIFGSINNANKLRRVPILGQAAMFSICGAKGPMSLEDAMHEDKAQQLIQEQAFNIARVFFTGWSLRS